jgi:peroxiredoxin
MVASSWVSSAAHYLIDENGKLRQEWRKVKVKGHVAEVLEAIKKLLN